MGEEKKKIWTLPDISYSFGAPAEVGRRPPAEGYTLWPTWLKPGRDPPLRAAPRTDPGVRNYRTGLPALGPGGKAHAWGGMHDADRG